MRLVADAAVAAVQRSTKSRADEGDRSGNSLRRSSKGDTLSGDGDCDNFDCENGGDVVVAASLDSASSEDVASGDDTSVAIDVLSGGCGEVRSGK
jgi:hypothetical protein